MKYLLKKLWAIIPSRFKNKFYKILVIMFAVSAAEGFTIGALFPFLNFISDPDFFTKSDFFIKVFNYLSISETKEIVYFLAICFVVLVVLSTYIKVLSVYIQTNFLHDLALDLSRKIYEGNLYQPYIEHVNRNSSEMIAVIYNKVNQVIRGTLSPILTIINGALICTIMILVLFYIEPMTTVIIFSIGFTYFLIIKKLAKRLVENSEKVSFLDNYVLRVLQEGFNSFRYISMGSLQSFFVDKFYNADKKRRKALANNQVLSLTPKFLVEAFILILAISIITYSGSDDPSSVIALLPVAGVIILAGQKMLPLANQMYSSIALIRGVQGNLKSVLQFYEDTTSKTSLDKYPIVKFENKIKFEDVFFYYPKSQNPVLKGINLCIHKGQKIGLIGFSGSGKSTFLDFLMGLLNPSSGKVIVDGVAVNIYNNPTWKKMISHVSQSTYLIDGTVIENIAFGVKGEDINIDRVIHCAKLAQVHNVILNLEKKYETLIGENGVFLSGGQRQRLAIARALYIEAEIIVFDEATSALDKNTESLVMDSMRQLDSNLTLIMVAHRMESLKYCDIIYEFKSGSIVSKGPIDNYVH